MQTGSGLPGNPIRAMGGRSGPPSGTPCADARSLETCSPADKERSISRAWVGIPGAGTGLPVAVRAWALADGARDLQSSPGLLCQRVEVRDAFIMQQQETWPKAVLCEGLAVSRRGFYAYVQRQAAPWRDHDAVALLAPTGAIHTQRRQSDGHRRMAKPLQADALPGGRYKARRLMPEAEGGGRPPQPRSRPPTS